MLLVIFLDHRLDEVPTSILVSWLRSHANILVPVNSLVLKSYYPVWKHMRKSLLTAITMLFILCQSFYKQLVSGSKVSISSAIPRASDTVPSQHTMPSRQVLPAPVVRQPLVGIDLQALNQAQKALKPPHASGNAKYMKGTVNEPNKVCEITNLNV